MNTILFAFFKGQKEKNKDNSNQKNDLDFNPLWVLGS